MVAEKGRNQGNLAAGIPEPISCKKPEWQLHCHSRQLTVHVRRTWGRALRWLRDEHMFHYAGRNSEPPEMVRRYMGES